MRAQTPEMLWQWTRATHQRGWHRLSKVTKALNFILHKCLLPGEAKVGSGLILEHYGLGVVIHPQTTIGNHCRIFHEVTLASETWLGSPHRIYIDDHVCIGVGAKVIARSNRSLNIGFGSVIGANAVITKDIGDYEIWGGVPGRCIGDQRERLVRLGLPIPQKTDDAHLGDC